MRVLVACEFSGRVRDAFLAKGHDAWSCDIIGTESPGPHIISDCLKVIGGWQPVVFTADCDPDGEGQCNVCLMDSGECRCIGPTQDGIEYQEFDGVLYGRPEDSPHWDLMIAHPPCTYLAGSGLHWNGRVEGRQEKTEEALKFVAALMSAPIEKICIENPVGCIGTRIRKADQIIQPWYFGENASKKTCLWLKGLPPLKDTNRLPGDNKTRRANQTPSGQNKLGPSAERQALRSLTYLGIAKAMADQWG